ELLEACTADVDPGTARLLNPGTARLSTLGGQPARRVPANWWTWLVQLLVPNSGPAVTSYTAMGEGLAMLVATMLLATIEAAAPGAAAEVLRWTPSAGVPMLASAMPAPQDGSPGASGLVPARQGVWHEQVPTHHRSQRPRPRRV